MRIDWDTLSWTRVSSSTCDITARFSANMS
jgi:hypothetical protein